MKQLKPFFLIVDIGFLLYWLVTLLEFFPERYLFKDYHDPILAAWNWSFLPLDMLISTTGLSSLYFEKRGEAWWRQLALMSLALTSCSGLQAVAFWALRHDFDMLWWAPNLFLLFYPLYFIHRFMRVENV